jgi:GT2 family glycosyltransferase
VISAVVINWNGVDHLPRCLDALLAQQPPPDEVLLVDNHSDDGSRALVAERYPGVRIVDTGANLGPAQARNVGVDAAHHELCLLIDNDVELLPGTLASLVEELEKDHETAVVQARSVCGDARETVHYDWCEIHVLGLLVLHNWFRPLASATPPPARVGSFIALCVLFRRSVYLQAGGFHAPLFILFEDNELSFRVRALGHGIRVADRAPCVHHGGTVGLSVRGAGAPYPARRTYLHARNRWLFLFATLRGRTFWLTLPVQLLYDGVHLGFSVVRGPAHVLAWLRGHAAALGGWPAARRRRRSLERMRKVADRDLLVAESGLTPNPGLAETGPRAWLRHGLDACVRLHWRLVRGICG